METSEELGPFHIKEAIRPRTRHVQEKESIGAKALDCSLTKKILEYGLNLLITDLGQSFIAKERRHVYHGSDNGWVKLEQWEYGQKVGNTRRFYSFRFATFQSSVYPFPNIPRIRLSSDRTVMTTRLRPSSRGASEPGERTQKREW